MKPFGKQLIAEFTYCSKNILNNKKALEQVLEFGIKKCGLHLKTLKSHQFHPIGITIVAVISESHIVIHTYPEAQHASIDIFTCSADPQMHIKLLDFLKSKLKPKTTRIIELERGNQLKVKEKDWITEYSPGAFEIRYHVKKKLLSKGSKYQQIDIIENEDFGRMLFLDNDLQIAEKDAHIYNSSLVTPLVESKNNLNKVAILGGGDGGVACELLKYNPKNVVLIEIDKEVISTCKKFLQLTYKNVFNNPNIKIVIDDANKLLEKNHSFDAIIYDLTMHPESLTKTDRVTFLNELFAKIKNNLNKDGLISIQCCSEFDTETFKLLKKILPKHFKNIKFRKAFIPSFCENWVFASAEVK